MVHSWFRKWVNRKSRKAATAGPPGGAALEPPGAGAPGGPDASGWRGRQRRAVVHSVPRQPVI